jgi:hypothetical protein
VRLAAGVTASEIEISTGRRLVGTGFLPGQLVLREAIDAAPDSAGILRFTTRGRVRPGRFWVAVSAMDVGLTSCVPLRLRGGCLTEWSNLLPLRVR